MYASRFQLQYVQGDEGCGKSLSLRPASGAKDHQVQREVVRGHEPHRGMVPVVRDSFQRRLRLVDGLQERSDHLLGERLEGGPEVEAEGSGVLLPGHFLVR